MRDEVPYPMTDAEVLALERFGRELEHCRSLMDPDSQPGAWQALWLGQVFTHRLRSTGTWSVPR